MGIFTKVAACAALAFAAVPAMAAELVTNGSFENGSAGWYSNNYSIFQNAPYAHTGSWTSGTGCVGAACTSSYNSGSYVGQSLATTVGTAYTLSFWVLESGGPTSSMSIFWGGNLISAVTNPANNTYPSGWVQYTYSGLVASSTATDLQIHGRQDPAGIYFDDISVSDGQTSAVPEPGTWLTMVLGFGALGAAMRRRRAAGEHRHA